MKNKIKMIIAKIRMLSWMGGVIRLDRIRNEYILEEIRNDGQRGDDDRE